MCIRIIGNESLEFNPNEPLELQIGGAKEILVSYDPLEGQKINTFVCQVESLIKNGVTCDADIKVNSNNSLDGMRLERKLHSLRMELGLNSVIKALTTFHSSTDRKLSEMLEKINER